MPVKFDNSRFLKIVADTRTALTEALAEGANDVVNLASQLAPVGDGLPGGHLKDSGKVHIISARKVEITFGDDLPDPRAIIQEYGSVYQPAQPYLTPALNQVDILFHVKKRMGL